MAAYPKALRNLMARLSRLPGIGPKSAERLALFMVKAPANEIAGLAEAMMTARKGVRTCSQCFNLTESDPCPICADPSRDPAQLCVVESAADLAALESAGAFGGRYFVLAGGLSPLEGRGPQEIRLERLVQTVRQNGVREVIIATNPTSEGEATADLLAESLARTGASVSRLGYGMPVGGDLQYMDGMTLSRSLDSRRRLK